MLPRPKIKYQIQPILLLLNTQDKVALTAEKLRLKAPRTQWLAKIRSNRRSYGPFEKLTEADRIPGTTLPQATLLEVEAVQLEPSGTFQTWSEEVSPQLEATVPSETAPMVALKIRTQMQALVLTTKIRTSRAA